MTNLTTLVESNQDDQTELFGDKECRWYQVAAKNQIVQLLQHNQKSRILLKLPTGAGKTLSAGLLLMSPEIKRAIANRLEDKPLRVCFITHKHRLRTQAETSFAAESSIKTIDKSNYQQSSMYKPK